MYSLFSGPRMLSTAKTAFAGQTNRVDGVGGKVLLTASGAEVGIDHHALAVPESDFDRLARYAA